MTRPEKQKQWIDIAREITESEGDRRRDYGRPLANFLLIAIYKTIYYISKLRVNEIITPLDVAKDNGILMKVARDHHRFKEDNFIDTIGYANCVDDMNQHMQQLGFNGVDDFRYFTLQDMYVLYQCVVDIEGTTKTKLGYEDFDHLDYYLQDLREGIEKRKADGK